MMSAGHRYGWRPDHDVLVAIDLTKLHFQICVSDFSGKVLFNHAFSRQPLIALLTGQPHCVVAMEAGLTSPF